MILLQVIGYVLARSYVMVFMAVNPVLMSKKCNHVNSHPATPGG